jgi:hypothetical protein
MTWSSTSAFVGYKIIARKAWSWTPSAVRHDRQFVFWLGIDHHSWMGGKALQPDFSLAIRQRRGIRKDSVLPEPVPDVTTGLYAPLDAKWLVSALAW